MIDCSVDDILNTVTAIAIRIKQTKKRINRALSDPESTEIDEEIKVPQVPQAYDLANPVRKREIKAKQKTLSVSDDDILSHYETKPRRERKAWTD